MVFDTIKFTETRFVKTVKYKYKDIIELNKITKTK